MSPPAGTRFKGPQIAERALQVKARLMKPEPPEGAHIGGPWGWGKTNDQADALLRKWRSLLTIVGLTIDEIAGDMVRWEGEKARRDEDKASRRRRHGNTNPRGASEEVPVIFRIWPEREGGDVIALFPTLPGSTQNRYSVDSYQHAGGHGSADMGLIHTTRPATPAEYGSLKRELESAPYNYKLKVYARHAPWMRQKLLAAGRR
jgi:hypothetical protein